MLVRGAVALADRARVSPLIVAVTIVALGTSLPEFIVVIQALVAGYPGILLGNVVGSNIANVLCVAGLTAVVYPVAPGESTVRRDAAIMVGASLAFAGLSLTMGLTRTAGGVLLLGLVGVLVVMGRDVARGRRDTEEAAPVEWVLGLPTSRSLILVFLGVGVVGLPLGARLIVDAAVEIAAGLGVTETVVGLTIIAFSTSLPELATTVVAAYRGRTDVVLGTIVGSNIFNIVAIMGVAAVLSPEPIPIPGRFALLDLPLLVAVALMAALFVWLRRPIGRLMGTGMMLAYGLYVFLLYRGL